MTEPLSPGTIRRIAALFTTSQITEVGNLLIAECGDNLPFADELGVERIRFAVLKISGGSIDRLIAAVDLAQQDWRDALMSAGFAMDVKTHLSWLAETEADSGGGV